MGYIRKDYTYTPTVTATGELLKNENYQIRSAIEEYAKHIENSKSIKQRRTELSNIRIFFNFLYEKHPGVKDLCLLKNEFIDYEQNIVNIRGKKIKNQL